MLHDSLSPSTIARSTTLQKPTTKISKHFAIGQVRNALQDRNDQRVFEIHTTSLGSQALVYQPRKDFFEGPYSVLDFSGEAAT